MPPSTQVPPSRTPLLRPSLLSDVRSSSTIPRSSKACGGNERSQGLQLLGAPAESHGWERGSSKGKGRNSNKTFTSLQKTEKPVSTLTVFDKAPISRKASCSRAGRLARCPVCQGAGPSRGCSGASSARRPAATLPPDKRPQGPRSGLGQPTSPLHPHQGQAGQPLPTPRRGALVSGHSGHRPCLSHVPWCAARAQQSSERPLEGCKSDDEKVEEAHAVLRGNTHIPTQNTC